MTWFKVDDGLHSHPKWLAASAGARALWVTAGSWCASHLTDGHVPKRALGTLGGRRTNARELVELGLWIEVDDGWKFHDWLTFQPSAQTVESEREAARHRQRRAREKSRESRRDISRDSREKSQETYSGSHGPPRHGPPDPTRPDLYENRGGENSRAASNGAPPTRRCSTHADWPDDAEVPACGACADARRAHDTWTATHPVLKPEIIHPPTSVRPPPVEDVLDRYRDAPVETNGQGLAAAKAALRSRPAPAYDEEPF